MMREKAKLAIATTAMTLATLYGGIGVATAQAQDEVLQATTTTFTGGSGGLCLKGSANATFSAAGPASGPYLGTFTQTDANVSVSVSVLTPTTRTLALSIPFTITSGSTTITGTVTNPPPYAGGSLLCASGWQTAGVIVAANGATYTATIQSQAQPAKKVSGTAHVSAAFQFRPGYVVGTPPTMTLLNFPSP